jgi:hypothetical protein
MQNNKLSELFNSGDRSTKWAEDCCNAIIDIGNFSGYARTRDQLCYDLFSGDTNTNTFDYLTGEGEMKYPAQVRFIPIIRPLFEVLRSTEATRPFEPQVYTVDPMSVEEKQDKMYKTVIEKLISRITVQTQQLDMLKMQIEYSRQQIQQAVQAGQQQQGQMQDPQQMINIQRMEMQLKAVDDINERARQVFAEEMSKASKYYKFDYRTSLEVAVSVGLRWWIAHYSVDELFLDGFNDLFLTDNEIYYIHDRLEGTDPMLSRVSPMDYYYPAQDGVRYLDELDWGMHVKWMSPSQVVQNYPHLSKGTIDSLRDGTLSSYSTALSYRSLQRGGNSTTQGTTNFADGNSSLIAYTGSSTASDAVPVYHTVWRTWEPISEDEVREAGVTGDLLCDSEYDKKDKKKKIWYVSFVWECTRIGNDTFVEARQCPFQFRDQESIGYSYLPYCGYAYNGTDRKPYSMMWAVRDIQELYNLVHYQMEVLIAMSGVKGFIMDESQMPDGMERSEWLYYLKQGVGLIQSMKKGSRPAMFNQFSQFDQTVSQGVTILTSVLERLEYLAGRLIGVPPQRMGEVTKNDQASTHRSAIAQSTLTTEMLFHKHRKLLNRVMNRVILVAREAWKEGKRGQFVAGDLGQEVFSLDPGVMDSASMNVYFADVSRETRIMESLTNMAGAQYNAGNIRLSQMTQLFKANTLKEMESSLAEFEEMALKQAENMENNRQASESERAKVQQEFALREKQTLSAADDLNAKLTQFEAQMSAQQDQMRNEAMLRAKNIDAASKTGVAQIKASTDMEGIKEEIRHNKVEERISALELTMNSMSGASSSSGS